MTLLKPKPSASKLHGTFQTLSCISAPDRTYVRIYLKDDQQKDA